MKFCQIIGDPVNYSPGCDIRPTLMQQCNRGLENPRYIFQNSYFAIKFELMQQSNKQQINGNLFKLL